MKKLVLLALLIFVSVSFAVIEHDETEATDKVSAAKDAVDGAAAAIDANLSIFEPHFDRCPEVNEQWDEANEYLNTAEERYDQAFDALELYQSDDAYDNAQQSLTASENVINTLDGLPNLVSLCDSTNNLTKVENETEPDIGCDADVNCASNDTCINEKCVAVECECGYVSNHVCHTYECCDDSDCSSGQECLSHSCSVIPVLEETTPPATEPEPAPTGCALSTVIILLSLVGVFLGRD